MCNVLVSTGRKRTRIDTILSHDTPSQLRADKIKISRRIFRRISVLAKPFDAKKQVLDFHFSHIREYSQRIGFEQFVCHNDNTYAMLKIHLFNWLLI